MSRVILDIRLPYPPSTNRLWRNFNGRMVMTAEARDYKALCHALALQAGCTPTDKPVSVRVVVQRPQRRGDLDNRLKAVLDALNSVAYDDDAQIVEIHALRVDSPHDGGVLVTVTELLEASR